MKVLIGLALAATVSAPAGELLPREKALVELIVETADLAYTFGACEHHFDRAEADESAAAILGTDSASTEMAPARALWAKAYARGRAESADLSWSTSECWAKIQAAKAKTAAARERIPAAPAQ